MFPAGNLDERVTMRGELALLRADPNFNGLELEQDSSALGRNHPSLVELYQVFFRQELENREVIRIVERRLAHETDFGISQMGVTEFTPPLLQNQNQDPNLNGDVLTPEVRERLVERAIWSQEGRTSLAQSLRGLMGPLRSRMDYQATARRTFLVDTLPDGTEPPLAPVFDKDPIPFVKPEWLVVGAWVRSDRMGISDSTPETVIAQVVTVKMLQVEYKVWRTDTVQRLYITAFAQEWEPCPEPEEPRARFDRLLDDDVLPDLSPKEVTVVIDGKKSSSFLARLSRKTYNSIVRAGGGPPKPATRFDRMDEED